MSGETETIQGEQTEPVYQVKLVKRYGCLFTGEIASFPKEVCESLHSQRIGNMIIDGQLIEFPAEEESQTVAAEAETQTGEADILGALNTAVQLFTADGLDDKIARALFEDGLDTPDKVREHIKAQKPFSTLKKAQVQAVTSLYAE